MSATPSFQPLPGDCTHLTLQATMADVRDGLQRVLACSCLGDLGEEDRGTVQLLLAEVLNNVVEHAYARWPGEIALSLTREGASLAVRISDQGLPMPDASPPRGDLPGLGAPEDLPEGGFGWFLIRSLAHDLTYRRIGQTNELSFRISVDNWEA